MFINLTMCERTCTIPLPLDTTRLLENTAAGSICYAIRVAVISPLRGTISASLDIRCVFLWEAHRSHHLLAISRPRYLAHVPINTYSRPRLISTSAAGLVSSGACTSPFAADIPLSLQQDGMIGICREAIVWGRRSTESTYKNRCRPKQQHDVDEHLRHLRRGGIFANP